FRGSIPGLHVPLLTLRNPPHGWPHIARGRHGSLFPCRTTLAFATPRRLSRRYPLYPPSHWVLTCFVSEIAEGTPSPPHLLSGFAQRALARPSRSPLARRAPVARRDPSP